MYNHASRVQYPLYIDMFKLSTSTRLVIGTCRSSMAVGIMDTELTRLPSFQAARVLSASMHAYLPPSLRARKHVQIAVAASQVRTRQSETSLGNGESRLAKSSRPCGLIARSCCCAACWFHAPAARFSEVLACWQFWSRPMKSSRLPC